MWKLLYPENDEQLVKVLDPFYKALIAHSRQGPQRQKYQMDMVVIDVV
jgi:hypothetical protein